MLSDADLTDKLLTSDKLVAMETGRVSEFEGLPREAYKAAHRCLSC